MCSMKDEADEVAKDCITNIEIAGPESDNETSSDECCNVVHCRKVLNTHNQSYTVPE